MRADACGIALTLLLALAPLHAFAWGPTGHRVVAALAERELSATTRVALRPLLARSHAQALADVATWADDLRDDRRRSALWHATSKLHFVNFADGSCHYDAHRDCPGGRCAVAAIERYADVLGDRKRDIDERAEALRMLVHLVADVHQPLHAGYRRDAGGNRHQVRIDGADRGTNLHALWDTPVLGEHHGGWRKRLADLGRAPLPGATGSAREWAEESCRMTRDAGLYPPRHRVDAAYLARARPLAERRLRYAAARLADLLNRSLGSRR
ncbi:MAG: S1/P1 nuclease [Dokdonella sp.]|uniref:S1/P1 nuclease n=1 Tax=Dokdonella sp. TaxID=2291710 RepID=UPI003F7E7AA0